ncbi:glycosyltransferase, partial [Pseudomonas aeruginosa]|nr:glycosyltransferase [Pseudomonas aeruginosa]
SAEATPADQAIYLRRLTNALNGEGYSYFVIEAFDQPWKVSAEGSVGAYWGVYNADRKAKFNFTGPVVPIPKWRALAIASAVLAVLAFTLLLIDSSSLRQRGRTFLAVVSFACASVLVWIAYDYSQQYSTWFSLTVGALLGVGALGVVIVLFTEAHELAEAVWTRKRRRPFLPITAAQAYRPKVSIHVPCYNEPPELLKQTLDALARLDYPDYEVLVIDNNTRDPAVWQPVEAHCARLGERFRFFHVAPLEGFKAGALNFALGHVAADVEVVAVIDADYCVDPDWLRHMVPHFGDPRIAVVQSPQDYRDQHESAFKRLCYAEYKGFFHIGMVTRNDRDAIIEHGTMTMIRRSVLDELRWPEWCITEDAELGLRVFEKGLSAAYFERSYGKGVMPDTFIDFKKQRFRWAYGAIQIMKRHTDALLRGRVIAQCSANSGLAQLLQTWLPRWGLEYKRLETDDSLLGHSLDVLISDCPDCLMGLRPSIGTPILLVTAYGSFLEPELARRLSPLRQLARPLSRNQLYQALKHVLEHTAIAPSSASDTTGEQRNTRVLLVEDNPVNQLVAKGL